MAPPLFCKSLLNTPALDVHRLNKAAEVGADMGVVDLEDPIPPARKEDARRNAVTFLRSPPPAETLWAVRINSPRTEDGLRDVLALLDSGARLDALIVPKVESPFELEMLDELLASKLPGVALLALIETARGLAAVESIARATPRLKGLVFGAADMAARLGVESCWETLQYARSRVVVAAALGGVAAIDAPFFGLEDAPGLALEVRRSHALGFSGKVAIHPRQIEAIHAGFEPSPHAVARAREVVEQCARSEDSILVVRGQMIGPPLLVVARRVLKLASRKPSGDRPPVTSSEE